MKNGNKKFLIEYQLEDEAPGTDVVTAYDLEEARTALAYKLLEESGLEGEDREDYNEHLGTMMILDAREV